jgi:hypothetical protein
MNRNGFESGRYLNETVMVRLHFRTAMRKCNRTSWERASNMRTGRVVLRKRRLICHTRTLHGRKNHIMEFRVQPSLTCRISLALADCLTFIIVPLHAQFLCAVISKHQVSCAYVQITPWLCPEALVRSSRLKCLAQAGRSETAAYCPDRKQRQTSLSIGYGNERSTRSL